MKKHMESQIAGLFLNTSPPDSTPQPCRDLQECIQVVEAMNLKAFFDERYHKCFKPCCLDPSHKVVHIRGNPPSKYVLPTGWCRVGIKVSDGIANANNIWKGWHVSFHGTTHAAIPSILAHGGSLLFPGDKLLDGTVLGIREGHIANVKGAFTSPTVRYSSLPVYAQRHTLPDGRTVQFVLQLRQAPGTYRIQGETVNWKRRNGDTPIDPHFSNNEVLN